MNLAAPIHRPQYSSTKGVEYVDWLETNHEAIAEWYIQTSEWLPEQHPEDFREFASCQFEIQCELDAVITDGLYELQLQEADNEDEPHGT